jgi:hypothetical protein
MSTPVAGQFNPTPISYQQQAYRGLPPNLQQQYQPLTFDQQQLYQSLDPYQQQRYLSLNVYHRQLYGWFVKVDTDNSGGSPAIARIFIPLILGVVLRVSVRQRRCIYAHQCARSHP